MSGNENLRNVISQERTWFQFFDMIRIIEPGGTHKVLYYEGSEEFDMKNPCFCFWNRSDHCANCVSKRAFMEKSNVMKFEYRNGQYYLVLAKPISYQEQEYILELVINITKQMTSDEEDTHMKDFVIDIVERLESASSKEAFTSLYNKAHMMELYEMRKSEARKTLYMALWDIDDFKLVNDIYGHDIGDKAILKIAKVLNEKFKSSGAVARFGGDEFGIIFQGEDVDAYKTALQATKENLDNVVYKSDGKQFHITVSYGIADVMTAPSFSDAIHMVDKELYYAKRKKRLDRNRI